MEVQNAFPFHQLIYCDNIAFIHFQVHLPLQINKNERSIVGLFTEGELKLTLDDFGSKDKLEHEIFKVVESSEYQDKEIDGLKLKVKDTKRSSVVVHLKSNGENVKLIVEKGIVNGDLNSFIRDLFDDENIKMHMIPGNEYRVSVSLHSKNKQKLFSGI